MATDSEVEEQVVTWKNKNKNRKVGSDSEEALSDPPLPEQEWEEGWEEREQQDRMMEVDWLENTRTLVPLPVGQPWSAWSELPVDNNPMPEQEDRTKLPRKDMFGHFPKQDQLRLCQCNRCGLIIKREAFLSHMQQRHEVEADIAEHSVDTCDASEQLVTVTTTTQKQLLTAAGSDSVAREEMEENGNTSDTSYSSSISGDSEPVVDKRKGRGSVGGRERGAGRVRGRVRGRGKTTEVPASLPSSLASLQPSSPSLVPPGPGYSNNNSINMGFGSQAQEPCCSNHELSHDNTVPTIKEILSARLENCLIDIGCKQDNIELCCSLLFMIRTLPASLGGLPDLKLRCHQFLLENISEHTVFSLLAVFDEGCPERETCIDFIVSNYKVMRQREDWIVNMKKMPTLLLEIQDKIM